MELLIITGLSGAGKSCVMNALEDVGYFCMDNLPPKLIPVFAKLLKESGEYEKVAVATDVRAGLTFDEFKTASLFLGEISIFHKVLFLDCDDEVLLTRYKQTRRIHPLMKGKCDTLSESITFEKCLLAGIKNIADYILNTSEFSVSDCKNRIVSLFSEDSVKQMHIHCISFGFKHGIPKDADYVFDVRFLPNPFYIPSLKERTGLDEEVRNYVMNSSDAKELESKLNSLISFIVPRCISEGRSQLIIAVGCTGGHHRSVTFVERLCKELTKRDYNVSVTHRDINK